MATLRHTIKALCLMTLHCNVCFGQSLINNTTHYNPEDPSHYSGWVEDPSHLCQGYYYHDTWEPSPEPSSWEIWADSVTVRKEGVSELQGQVHLQHGQRHFFASELNIESKAKQIDAIRAKGPIIYLDPSMQITGQGGYWQATLDTLQIENPQYYYFERHARGRAEAITVTQRTKVDLKQATYTTCAPQSNTWALNGRAIHLNQSTGRGYAKDIKLTLKEVPVFYWPYLQFPIDKARHTGFLFPEFGSTTQSGLELSIPFYWNIAPNYDATITPRILTRRGVDLQTEGRYLTEHHQGQLKVHFLPQDKKYQAFRNDNLNAPPIEAPSHDPRLVALQDGQHRLGIQWKHTSQYNKKWLFDVDLTYVGDDNYFYDLENDLGSSSTTKLNRKAQLKYDGRHWHHQWLAQDFDLLHPLFGPVNQEDYAVLPSWRFWGYYPSLGSFETQVEGEVTHFSHPIDPITGQSFTQGMRYHARLAMAKPWRTTWGYFTPKVQADFLSLDVRRGSVESVVYPSHPSRLLPILSVDTGLFFDKKLKAKNTWTLEPRLYYLYVPTKNQDAFQKFDTSRIDFSFYQMFRDNRFSGKDRLGDTHQTTLAWVSRLLDAKGHERLRATVGEIFYFKQRSVTLCAPTDLSCIFKEDPNRLKHFSPLIANVNLQPNAIWQFNQGLEWDPNHGRLEKAYLHSEYTPNPNLAISAQYYWMRQNPYEEQKFLVEQHLNQGNIGLHIPFNRRIDLLAQYRYDFEHKRTIEWIAGFEYDSCCLAFQLMGARRLRPNDGLTPVEYANSVFFQVLFKGLSNLGTKQADDKLAKTIPNYTPFARRDHF